MSILDYIKSLLRRREDVAPPSDEAEPPENPSGAVWCVAANVVHEHAFGPGKEIRRGTKHFAPGAKVYVYDFHWGGRPTVKVVGRHRRSHRYIRLMMPAKQLTNWRPELVYSPYITTQIRNECGPFAGVVDDPKRSEELAIEFAENMRKEIGGVQPFLTRPPATE